MAAPPIVWSIAGTDSGGGAGLSADQRAADACSVHLCPVVAAVTAQHSLAVRRVEAMPVDLIDAQLSALAEDMPPRVVKTGLLGGAEQVRLVARWIDRLRQDGDVALVVDPVLGASSGGSFADAATLQAYRDELLPRASVLTPNRREARALLGHHGRDDDAAELPLLAAALREAGAAAVCITGGDSADRDGDVLDWLASEHASGWLASPRIATAHQHGTGCTFATSLAAALARGFVAADAAVIAKMATGGALRAACAAGSGPGPVRAEPAFITEPSLLPRLSWGEEPRFEAVAQAAARPLGLYAIVDSSERLQQVLAAGVRTVQLRIKTPPDVDAAWTTGLRSSLQQAITACREAGAELFINDHWQLARELGAGAVHLGQEDLLALGEAGRAELAASGLALGISTHSLWELCRARSLAPRYIACGPVWPTLTKAMPWRPQGLVNLRWWQRMAGAPVVAIGGILSPERVQAAAEVGVDGVCVVRAIDGDAKVKVALLQQAMQQGEAAAVAVSPGWPQSSLCGQAGPAG
ncbi:bifunctional hydroxymethylpyrimidine kinase/phosphomethylpyrimidine kinase [Piscinibacter sakaiensis]|uniref:bifunctional hydroxymethylpyrimidine kinase/phosphomethylpyrimidine kinase n=1 Tax=Piscinibacter sakaiensis TaxID=1547922 RepID=UPI003AABDD44